VIASTDGLDLAPYAGRWIAIVRGQVAGVGLTPEEARRLAKRNRPKEEPVVVFVSNGGEAEVQRATICVNLSSEPRPFDRLRTGPGAARGRAFEP